MAGPERPDTPELRLWREVLRLLLKDITQGGGTLTPVPERRMVQRRARQYIGGPSYRLVCHLAGYDPDVLLRALERRGALRPGFRLARADRRIP